MPLKRPNFRTRCTVTIDFDKMRRKIDILGIPVDDVSFDFAVGEVLKLARGKKRGSYVVTVNPEFVMLARRDSNFAGILKNADLALADGHGVVISKLVLGGKEQDRVTGVDLVEKLCQKCAKGAVRIGFLGGFEGVADEVRKRQIEANPKLKVVFAEAGDPAPRHDRDLTASLDRAGAIDMLFVGYGMGKQEYLIDRIRKNVDVGVFIGVGGALDYLSGAKKRAPKIWQKAGIEWLWRLLMDPARIWRMRVLPIFAVLVFTQFLKRRYNL